MHPVLGIDTASNRLHFFSSAPLTDIIGQEHHLCGWMHCKDKDANVRRAMILDYARGIFSVLPDGASVFCEEPLALQNGKTTRLLGLAAGAIWAAFQMAAPNATWFWVDQSSWKRDLQIPRGGDHKQRIMDAISALPQFEALPAETVQCFLAEDDLYDAFGIMLYGVDQLRRRHEDWDR